MVKLYRFLLHPYDNSGVWHEGAQQAVGTADDEQLDNEQQIDGEPDSPTEGQDPFKYRTKYGSKYRNEQELLAGKEQADKFIEEVAKPQLAKISELEKTVARLQGRQEVTEQIANRQAQPRPGEINPEVQAAYHAEFEDMKRLGYDDEVARNMATRNVTKEFRLRGDILREVQGAVQEEVGTTRKELFRGRYNELKELYPEFDFTKNPLAKAAYDEDPAGSPDKHFRSFKDKYKTAFGREFQSSRDEEVYEADDNIDFEQPQRPTGRQRQFARSSGGSAPSMRRGGGSPDPQYVRDSMAMHKHFHPDATAEDLAEIRKNAIAIAARKKGGTGYYG